MSMNISDIQKQNTESPKMQSIKNYAALKENSSDFSYYVEVGKTQEMPEQIEDVIPQEEQSVEEELLSTQEGQTEGNLAYVQSFKNMNDGLFNLGIINDKNSDKTMDMFKYNINLKDLTMDDIKLFTSLTQKSDLAVNSFNPQNQTFNAIVNGEGMNISYRSLEVSKTLFTAIENAAKTNKPVRLDFGNNTSVILKISKDGKLSAEFLPNDKAMEAVLRSALPELKAKFDEENIPYEQLSYKNFNQQKDNHKKDKEKKKDE